MFASVIVDIASSQIDKVFDYIVPESMSLEVGTRVLVPFGKREIEGIVVKISNETNVISHKLKEIIKPLENFPVITNMQMQMAEFLKREYHIGLADSFRLFLPSEMRSGKVKDLTITNLFIEDEIKAKEYLSNLKANATKQKGAILKLLEVGKINQVLLNKEFGQSAVSKLKEEGIIKSACEVVFRKPYKNVILAQNKNIVLTPDQERVASLIKTKPAKYLLFGVTGSGKTEVYINVIKSCIENNKAAIMLVPEISLTPQVLGSFRARFGENVAILHSGLSSGERFDEWKRILLGQAKIVVGARSAIFAPMQNIGAIIIDEEHDGSYVSESHPRYNTLEIAEFLSEKQGASLVLGSATPSLDSYNKAIEGKYCLLELKNRVNAKPLPPLKIVDMAREMREGNPGIFSRALEEAIERTLKEGNQIMLFLNRRGYASFLMCKKCGWVAKCKDCDVSLVYHRAEHALKCHYCGNRYKVFTKCPNCDNENLKEGLLGTQQVVEKLREMFPGVKILRMDNDTTTTKDAHVKILNEFRENRAQILVGTQMIAKGHDFPQVTLVGIIDADVSLHQTTYKATERTFELITQVAGRAGRADKAGEIILQTYAPRHYVYNMAMHYDYTAFYKKEANMREVTSFPPFATIFRILISGENEDDVRNYTKILYTKMQEAQKENKEAFVYLGVMKSPIGRIQNKFRYQILMRIRKAEQSKIKDFIFNMLDENKSQNILAFVEINPQNLS
ncbi:MAG: primosomal protein N' [Clostridia bacterium]|nr:primosomal protein N' [Clostridia bacterium]